MLLSTQDVSSEPVRVGHVEAELVSEVEGIRAGQPFWVGLSLQMDEHWHVYWRNAGDAGIPPSVEWDLPDGFTAGEIHWPYPEFIELPPLANYGYHGDLLLPVMITPPAELGSSDPVVIKAGLDWLVCKEECIPGRADLSIQLPISSELAGFDERWAAKFNETRQQLPVNATDWKVSASLIDRKIVLDLDAPDWFGDSLQSIRFFPYERGIIENAASQSLRRTDTGYELVVDRSRRSIEDPERVSGILVSESGWRGTGSEKAIEIDVPIGAPIVEATSGVAAGIASIWKAVLFAFLGGVILNLMPCVLPVLSLKVLGFVQQANSGRSSVLRHGLVFAAGVILSFWVLAGLLAILRAGGEQIGWGFQLQSPAFIAILSSFLFLFGLSLFGVFEVGTSLGSVGASGGRRHGYWGSLLNGVTATVVATPCTAPFMGSALGFSLSQPGYVSWIIFTSLGAGMAAPYVILSAFPRLMRLLPKPGRWMETLKQFMGFLLMATVIWLLWVLGIQAGVNAAVSMLVGLLVLGVGGWVFGRWGGLSSSGGLRLVAYSISLMLVLAGIGIGLAGTSMFGVQAVTVSSKSDGLIQWEKFSPQRVEELKEAGKPFFVDFTAAWCLSCQVNEKVAFGSREVQEKFADLGVTAIKADWTSRDESITRALAEFGRNSVPLYVLYGSDRSTEPVLLPEIITPGIVLDALQSIENKYD